jgi:hypothetical protein
MKKEVAVKYALIILLLASIAQAKVFAAYPPVFNFEHDDPKDRISYPHIYPGQTFTSGNRFFADPMRPGTSTVRWTNVGAYSIVLDKIHLERKDYVLIIKSKRGPQIKILPFETTKIYLEPDYYPIRYDRETMTVWLARYAR